MSNNGHYFLARQKKGQIFVCVLLSSLIQNRKIHTLRTSNLLIVNGSENIFYPLNSGVRHHPHLSGRFFCLCLQCGQWLGFAFLLLLLSLCLFSFSRRKKESKSMQQKLSISTPTRTEILCCRSLQNRCFFHNHEKNLKKKTKNTTEKGNDRILPNIVSFVVLKKMHFSF